MEIRHRLLLSVKLSFNGSSLALSVLASPLAKPPWGRLYPMERKRWAKYKKSGVRRGVNILAYFRQVVAIQRQILFALSQALMFRYELC